MLTALINYIIISVLVNYYFGRKFRIAFNWVTLSIMAFCFAFAISLCAAFLGTMAFQDSTFVDLKGLDFLLVTNSLPWFLAPLSFLVDLIRDYILVSLNMLIHLKISYFATQIVMFLLYDKILVNFGFISHEKKVTADPNQMVFFQGKWMTNHEADIICEHRV